MAESTSFKERLLEQKNRVLENENSILRERISFLEKMFMPQFKFPPEWELTSTYVKILSAFMGTKGRLTKKSYELLLYADRMDSDLPDMKIVDVLICKIRALFKRHGVPVTIHTNHGSGYTINDEDLNYLNQFLVEYDRSGYDSLKAEQKKVG